MKKFTGVVFSDKMNKAATVMIEHYYRHPRYRKILKKKKKIHAANEIGAKTGQLVEITEVRPISKTITFRITKVIADKEG